MIHARDDYNRIQDPAGKIPEDEPVFLLRAQDMLAWQAVSRYGQLCQECGLHDLAALSFDQAQKMRDWQKKKVPDLPVDAS